MPHRLAFVVITDPAFKRGVTAAGRINHPQAFGLGIDTNCGEAEGLHHYASAVSAAGHGRNEHDRIAFAQRLRPVTELGVDRDSQVFDP